MKNMSFKQKESLGMENYLDLCVCVTVSVYIPWQHTLIPNSSHIQAAKWGTKNTYSKTRSSTIYHSGQSPRMS